MQSDDLFSFSVVVEEYECWECWNSFRVSLRRPPIGVVTEVPCPYCDRQLEFGTPVLALEPIDIRTPDRRLRNLRRRLIVAGSDMLIRIHDLERTLSRWDAILAKARRLAGQPGR